MALDPLKSTFKADAHELQPGPGAGRGIFWVYPEARFSEFSTSVARLGRGEDCSFRLLGSEVSRHHAELHRRGPLLTLTDLGSTNGTFVNGERLASTPTPLADQDVVRLGEWIGVVCTLVTPGEVCLSDQGGMVCGLKMQALLAAAAQVAPSRLPVLLVGESGTGKELVSRFIHDQSTRVGPLVAVNCAAIPEHLAESELFGHKRGAFTGADRASDGYVRTADRGTLFLDEVGDLPMSIQAKLLRVLEQSQVVPLGSSTPVEVDVRLIAAGQHSLIVAVKNERFRGDLFARLNGIELRLPPLRERREEILAVFQRVVEKELCGHPTPSLSPRFIERLCTYAWPFNVRELVQVARQVAVLHRNKAIWSDDLLPLAVTHSADAQTSKQRVGHKNSDPRESGRLPDTASIEGEESSNTSLRERRERAREQELVKLQDALDSLGGNVSEAAKVVGISRRKAYRLLKGLDPDGAED